MIGRSRHGSFAVLALFLTSAAQSAEPLHQRIDQAIESALPDFAKKAAPLADDAEFLRRITLDLTGTIPTVDEAKSFLGDPSPGKRTTLIDQLLASAAHARHLATVFDVMLMERRTSRAASAPEWFEFLRSSFQANKPWDQLTREILNADGATSATKPASRFYLDRDAEPHLLTRDISRLFLGMNLQCAQCHDHPKIEDYRQENYYGLFAFLNRTVLSRDKTKKVAFLTEKPDGDATFVSVFDPAKVMKRSGPRIPDRPPLAEPPTGAAVGVAIGARPKSRLSRRALLAPALTDPTNPYFRRNIANRLWALMMGRGLVHPLDMDHGGNPPSHPELLIELADDLAAHGYDLRYLLRELALSRTYQRSSEPPEGVEKFEPTEYAVAALKPLTPEQFAWSLMQASGLTDATRRSLGAKATDAALAKALAGNVPPFIKAFGSGEGQPQSFDARADQALFLANGTTVRGWSAPRPGNLTARLTALATTDSIAEELYLSVLTRRPSAEERQDVARFLAEREKDRPAALQDLAWALLASAEFRFNH